MNESPQPTALQWLALAVAVFVLNAAITFHNIWPTLLVTTRFELSIEIGVFLLVLVVASARGRYLGRGATNAITALLVIFVVARYFEVTAPGLYGRPVNLYWDAPHLPKVAAMLIEVAPWWLVAALVLGIAMLLAAIAAALRWCVRCVSAAVASRPMRRALGVVATAVVGLYVVTSVLDWRPRHWYSLPVSGNFFRQAKFIVEAYAADSTGMLPSAPLPRSDLGRLRGDDVLVVFLESYGATTYDAPAIEALVRPAREDFAAAARDTGRTVASAFIESPTFGGGSWLAHSSFMSGFDVRDPGSYSLLLTQQRDTLPKLFEAGGYRAVAVMPGMKNAWPEGVFYGFDKIYGERDLDYRGPDFGWWRIPDQYSLAKLPSLEGRSGSRRPLFVFLPTINTHIPFMPLPPYQPDWERLLGEHPFDADEVAARVNVTPDWTKFGEPYGESFAYTFTYLAGFLRERADTAALLVVIGDHQPAASVTGPGARWDVPVHVVTRRLDIAAALLDAGFIDGVGLGARPAIGTMKDLTALLLRAFDSSGPGPSD